MSRKHRQDTHQKPQSVTFGKWHNHYTWSGNRESARLRAASTLSQIARGKLSREQGAKQLPEALRAMALHSTPAELLAEARKLSTQ